LTRTLAAQASAVTYDALPEPVRAWARQMRARLLRRRARGADDPLAKILLERIAPKPRHGAGQHHRPHGAAPCPVGRAGQRRDRPRARLRRRQFGDAGPSLGRDPARPDRARRAAPEFRAEVLAALSPATRSPAASAWRSGPAITNRGFHATGTVGCFGAAAACAHLLGLDADATARALGIAGTQAAGLKSQFGTMCKPFHAGKASQSGLLAARLAARGFSSRPDLVECEQGFALTHGPDFNPAAALESPPNGFHIFAKPVQVPRRLLPDTRIDRMRPQPARAARDRADQVARMTLSLDRSCDRVCNIPARPMGSKPSSACARPWRWRCPASIPRASPPTAPRRRPTGLGALAREARARFP